MHTAHQPGDMTSDDYESRARRPGARESKAQVKLKKQLVKGQYEDEDMKIAETAVEAGGHGNTVGQERRQRKPRNGRRERGEERISKSPENKYIPKAIV